MRMWPFKRKPPTHSAKHVPVPFVPIGEPEVDPSLVGCWSVDACYGPGAQSDDVLLFRDNGRGRYEFINFTLAWVLFFHWQLDRDGRLKVSPFARTENTEDAPRTVVRDESSLVYQASVRLERTPRGEERRVLRMQSEHDVEREPSSNPTFPLGPYGFCPNARPYPLKFLIPATEQTRARNKFAEYEEVAVPDLSLCE